MKNRLVMVCLAALALALFVGTRALADDKNKDSKDNKNQMEGKIVRIEGNKIVMTDKDGKNDIIYGGPGNDILTGEDGDDTLAGDGGSDMIRGGSGRDTVTYADHTAPVTAKLAQ